MISWITESYFKVKVYRTAVNQVLESEIRPWKVYSKVARDEHPESFVQHVYIMVSLRETDISRFTWAKQRTQGWEGVTDYL